MFWWGVLVGAVGVGLPSWGLIFWGLFKLSHIFDR